MKSFTGPLLEVFMLLLGTDHVCSAFSAIQPKPQAKAPLQLALHSQDTNAPPTNHELTRRRAMGQVAGLASAAFTATRSGLLLPANAVQDSPSLPTSNSIIPTVSLGSSNLQISRSIQGYWQLAGGHGKYREPDALANMRAHYQAGFTSIDTADIYGPSERIIGSFVNQQQQSSLPSPTVCTKFCCFRFLDDIDREEVKTRILKACERLQLPKLPLVQFFWSNYSIKRYVDVALYLTELREQGLIGEIGATNFDLVRLQELVKNDIPIVSHQVQLSAMDRRPIQSGMADWCLENNIKLIGFGTVASGILSNEFLGAPKAPTREMQNTASLRLYSATAERFGDWPLVQELLRTMDAIAKNVRADGRCPDANISNVAQRYVLDTPAVAAIIIGVRNQDHIKENVRTHSFTLTQEEREAIDKVVAKRKGPQGDVWDIERGNV